MTTPARADPSGSQCRSNSVRPSDVENVDEVRRIRGILPTRRASEQTGGSRLVRRSRVGVGGGAFVRIAGPGLEDWGVRNELPAPQPLRSR